MSEEKTDYVTEVEEALAMLHFQDNQPHVVIEPPRKVNALSDQGMVEIRVWGWVKISSHFIKHIRVLKGAKLAIWQVIALSIDESGKCNLSVPQIAKLSGYSPSEVYESMAELDTLGYLSVKRDAGKRNLYEPEFVARGGNIPSEDPSRKTTPPAGKEGYPSSPPREKSDSSISRVKRVNGADAPNEFPVDWQLGHGQTVALQSEEDEFNALAKDTANLIDMRAPGAGALALAFMLERKILIPEGKIKGNRKAAKEMLSMKVQPSHITEATRKLVDAGMTVTSLFSVSNTAIDLANPAPERQGYNPQGLEVKI